MALFALNITAGSSVDLSGVWGVRIDPENRGRAENWFNQSFEDSLILPERLQAQGYGEGPGHDWTPDHNWGGSGMIGLQKMLMQTIGDEIRLFPAWPKEWDVDFKLHAPQNTVIEGVLKNGQLTLKSITPESRRKDIINMLQ